MNKYCLIFLLLFPFFLAANPPPPSHKVLVSVAPFKCFVEKIAQNTVDVILMVPSNASSHTYEPTPRQMDLAVQADIWFTLGEPFEARAIQALKSYRPNLVLVDMRQKLDLLEHHCGCVHGSHSGGDPHIWLSPRMAKIQAATIVEALSDMYPEHRNVYQSNYQNLLQQLDLLDSKISNTLAAGQNRTILVSHPAYGYLCRDYNLQQLSIEFEGKDPTPRQLTRLLDDARRHRINTIFTQMQYSNKAATLVAQEIGAKLVNLDPYSEDYFNSLEQISRCFSESF